MSSTRIASYYLVLFAIPAILALGCASVGTRLEPPEISLVNLAPLPSTGFEQQFEITLRVLNPNEVPLKGDGIDLKLDVNGQRLGRALSSEPFVIPRLSDATVKLVATTSMIDVFRQAAALPSAGGKIEYLLSGRVLLADSFGWLRFTRKGNLTSGMPAAR